MPNANDDRVYQQFVTIAEDFVAISGGLTALIGGLAIQSPAAVTSPSSPAPIAAAVASADRSPTDTFNSVARLVSGGAIGSGSGALSTFGAAAKSVGENALGAVPLIRGIISLFGGGDDSPAPSKLTKYLLPPSLQFEAADTPAGIRNVDYSQTSTPRPFGATSAAPAAITVNIQAMDARSFLDRSSDIAAAVREAMLNSSSLNDVVSEL